MEEEILFEFAPCHVFRLPPFGYLSSATWEGGHIWSGTVRLVRQLHHDDAPTHAIDLLVTDGLTLFGRCPLKDGPSAQSASSSFQVASDSSRCFVVRVEQGEQYAYLGLNFEEKADAFKFCTAVIERNKNALRSRIQTPNEEGISRYTGHQISELRAEGKIEVNLAGKWSSSAAQKPPSTQNSNTGFSLDHLPRASGATNRRITSTAKSNTTQQQPTTPLQAQPTTPLASSSQVQLEKIPVVDPFADFPSTSTSTSRPAAAPPAVSSAQPSVQPSVQTTKPSANIEDIFGGLDIAGTTNQTASTSNASAVVAPATGLDAYF